MMPSTKLALLAGFILLVIAGYTLLWFTLADRLQGRVESFLADLGDEGLVAKCDNLDVRGYPFRIGVFCDAIRAENGGEFTVAADAFRSTAQVYNPGHIVSELDGPLQVSLDTGESLSAEWDVLQASTVFSTDGLMRTSLAGRGIDGNVTLPAGAEAGISAETAEFHARRRGADLDVAFRATDAGIDETVAGAALPAVDVVAEATLHDGAGFLGERAIEPAALRGSSGRLEDARLLLPEGGALTLSGPFEIAENGEISGAFEVSVEEPAGVVEALAAFFPDYRDEIERGAGMIASFAGGEDGISFDVQVREGRVFVGIIPLGRIPAI
jgi:hypothetical protein